MEMLVGFLPRPSDAARKLLHSNDKPRQVLFLRYEKIGDLLLATSAIRAIAESSPHTVVDVLSSPESAPMLRGNPFVRHVHVFDRNKPWRWPRLWRRFAREKYDIVVDGRINHERSFGTTPLILLMTGARVRIGAQGEGRERVYTETVSVDPHAHFAAQSVSVVSPFGIDPAKLDLKPLIFLDPDERRAGAERWLELSPRDDSIRLLVNVSSGGPRRYWPNERYVAVIRDVSARFPHAVIRVIGLPDEAEKIKSICAASHAVYTPTKDIREASAIVASADLVFTPDTAISHIAAALGVPVVVMMTSVPESRMVYSPDAFKPIGANAYVVRCSAPRLAELDAGDVCETLATAMAQFEPGVSARSDTPQNHSA
jgi:heptosyltransferase-3